MNNNILKGIGFENFRVFKQQTLLDFAPLTVLTGTNSSGKSSIINGMKLIKESFSNVTVSGKAEDIELDSLFNVDFNASEMMKRYGTLDKYINHYGKDKRNYSLKLFIPTRLPYVMEEVLITYTIQVEENEQKTGKITKIEMKLVTNESSLFKVEKRSESYHIKIDLSAFVEILIQGDIHGKIQGDIHGKSPDEIEIAEILDGVTKQIKKGKFYDFSFLWAEDSDDEKLFEAAMNKFYGAYNAETFQMLCADLLCALSSTEKKTSKINHLIYFNKTIGLSLLDAALRYFGKGNWKSVPGKSWGYLGSGNNGFQKLLWNEIEKLNNKNDFIDYIFKMVANKQSYYDKPLFSKEERKLFKASERKLTEIKSFESNDVEKYFYEHFLFPSLNLLKTSFLPFVSMEAVSAERSSTKGIKSILDSDDFSRLMKERFSAKGLKKDAFIELDRFLNKWLKEFKIAEEIKFEKDEDYDVFKVKLLKNGNWMMLSDEGFGVSQVLPVILSCCPIVRWNYEIDLHDPFKENKPKLVLIEEPETNLHPALQSKLADMFIDAVKTFNIRFVIETHSEYLIRKLQYLTGKGDIKPEQTVIYYFYPPTEVPEGEKQVKKINIQQDGSLTDDFGTGFFDEATNWKFELLTLKNHQNN